MTSLHISKKLLGPAAILVALVSACSEPPPSPHVPARIDTFEATPARVAAGDPTRLSWSVSGDVDRVSLMQGARVLVEGAAAEDAFDVEAVEEGATSFLLVAWGEDGAAAQASVSVVGVTSPGVVSFTASREQAPVGAAVVLSWRTLLSDEAVLYANDVEVARYDGSLALQGQVTVRPEVDTEYRLVVSGLAGEAEAKVTVEVNEAPAFTASAVTPERVLAGETVSVSWTVERASTLTLKDGARTLETITGEEVASGSRDFVVEAARTFTLVAEGAGGVEQVSLPVSVVVAPRVESFLAAPAQIVVGDEVTLSWTVAGAETLTLFANDEAVVLDEPGLPAGTVTLSPVETTVYALHVAGPGGDRVAELTVDVYGTPVVGHFDASPREIFLRRDPAVLAWTTSAAAAVSVSTSTGEIVDLGGAVAAAGQVEVFPSEDTTYVLTATGPGGSVDSAPVTVTVQEPPPLIRLSLLRDPINRGMTSELSWSIIDADTFSLETSADGETFTAVDVSELTFEDALPTAPTESTTYRLTATNAYGTSVEEVRQTVVNPPAVKRFEVPGHPVIDGSVYVTMDEPFTVAWETTDTDGVVFDPPMGFVADDEPFVSLMGLDGTQSMSVPTGNNYADFEFPEGFRFPFFGKDEVRVKVAPHGFLCFGDSCGTSASSTGQQIPASGNPNGIIAAFWDGLKSVSGQSEWLYRLRGIAPDRSLTIEWHKMDMSLSSEDGEEITFQVVLFESGLWEIRHAPRVPGTKNAGKDLRWGTGATIGVESPDGSSALLISYRDATALCSEFTPGSGSTPGTCTPITRLRPALLSPDGSAEMTLTPPSYTNNTRTLYLRAVGPLGAVKGPELSMRVNRLPTNVKLSASKPHVGAGESVRFTFSGNMNPRMDFDRYELRDADGVVLHTVSGEQSSTAFNGTLDFEPTKDTSYTFVVYNKAQRAVESDEVRVVLGPPTLEGVTVTPDFGAMKDRYTIAWTSSVGASRLRLIDPLGATIYDEPMPTGTSIVPPDLTVPGDYTLIASNGSGDSTPAVVHIAIDQDVKVVSFAADVTEQTTGKPVVLRWETYNASSLTLYANDVLVDTYTDPTFIRDTTRTDEPLKLDMGPVDTVYRLEATGDGGTATATVTVIAAPQPKVLTFSTDPSTVDWKQPFKLRWTTQNATTVRIQEVLVEGDQVAIVREFPVSEDMFAAGEVTTSTDRATTYRAIAENRVGEQDIVLLNRNPRRGPQALTFEVTPVDGTPRQGYSDLTWTADQVDGVKLWEGLDGTRHQVPVEYVPHQFEDISGTGQVLELATTAGVANHKAGFAVVDFPDAFRPPFFGEKMAGMLVSARGVITLSPTPTDLESFACLPSSSTDTSTCNSAISHTSTSPNGFIAPFQGPLNGCYGTTTPTQACTNRPDGIPDEPGQVFWLLRGQAPDRVLIVQWNNWDVDSTSKGRLTFQAKLYENGNSEFQYKRLYHSDMRRAGGDQFTLGVKSYDGTTRAVLDEFASNNPVVFDGDGYRFYTGVQPITRTTPLRSRFFVPTSGSDSSAVNYRAATVTPDPSPLSVARAHAILPGNFLITELMVDTGASSDLGGEWIEITNLGAEANLKGYTLTTASSFATPYTFTEDLTVPRNGAVLVAQGASPVGVGNAVVSRVYGEGVRLHNVQDTVILRYGDVLVDRVEYDKTAGWKVPRGRSLMLDPRASSPTHNDLPGMWCSGRVDGEASAVASPAALNHACMRWVETPEGYDASVDLETRLEQDPAHRVITGYSATLTNQAYDVPLGFEFPYFGQRYSTVNVAALGFVALGNFLASGSSLSSPSSSSGFPMALTYGGQDMIAPFFATLGQLRSSSLDRPTAVYVLTDGEAPNRRFIVHWASYRMASGTSYPVDFSLVLDEQGGIEFHYKELTVTTSTSYGSPIGLQAFGTEVGLTAFKGPPSSTNSQDTDLTRIPAVGSSLKLVRFE